MQRTRTQTIQISNLILNVSTTNTGNLIKREDPINSQRMKLEIQRENPQTIPISPMNQEAYHQVRFCHISSKVT